jgi:hypothetical protein
MGSLRIGDSDSTRTLGTCASKCEFDDRDGTLVSAVLTLDKCGALFELDVWRVDFQPLQQWPSRTHIRPGSAAA